MQKSFCTNDLNPRSFDFKFSIGNDKNIEKTAVLYRFLAV